MTDSRLTQRVRAQLGWRRSGDRARKPASALLIAALLAVAACSSGASHQGGGAASSSSLGSAPAAVGVTADSITISVVAGLSGAYGQVITPVFNAGFQTWVDDINAHGGIYGRKVIVHQVDHGESADGGVAACKQIQSNGSFLPVIVEGQGEGNFAAADCLDKAGVTNLAFAGAPSPSWTHTYGFVPSAPDQGTSLATFVQHSMGDGGKKLGVIYLSPPAYAAAKDAYVQSAKSGGLNVVDTESIAVNQASFTPQLLRLKNAGAQNVAIIATTEAIGILRDASSLDYHPDWTGIYWTYDFITQAARKNANGAMTLGVTADVDSPAWPQLQAKQRQYGTAGSAPNVLSLAMYGAGLLTQRVLEAAGPNPTQASLTAGLHSISGYDNQILAPITYTATDHTGTHASFPLACCHDDFTWKQTGAPAASF